MIRGWWYGTGGEEGGFSIPFLFFCERGKKRCSEEKKRRRLGSFKGREEGAKGKKEVRGLIRGGGGGEKGLSTFFSPFFPRVGGKGVWRKGGGEETWTFLKRSNREKKRKTRSSLLLPLK